MGGDDSQPAVSSGGRRSDPSFFVPACDKQAEGIKPSMPQWSLKGSTRDQQKRVYIGESHTQDMKGFDSPGPVYRLNGKAPGPYWKFGSSERKGLARPGYPPTSNDLMDVQQPSSDMYKHKFLGATKFGTETRDACKNQPYLKGFAPGRISPGPAQYTPDFYAANQAPPKYSMGAKTQIIAARPQTTVKVAPNSYDQGRGIGTQYTSVRETKPKWSFSKAPRFKVRKEGSDQANPSGDQEGKVALKYKRNANAAPIVGFGSSTRSQAQQLALCGMEGVDLGYARMPHVSHPNRKIMLKYSSDI